MVNGKPNLTFGGATPVSGRANERTFIGGRNADNFASLLPAELGRLGGAPPSAQAALGAVAPSIQNAVAPSVQGALTPPVQTTQGGGPVVRGAITPFAQNPVAPPVPGVTAPALPVPLSPASARNMLQNAPLTGPPAPAGQGLTAARASTVPANPQSPAQARALAQASPLGMVPQNAILQPQRTPATAAPRVISGSPITGRNHIGMTDTRKSGGLESLNTGRPAFTPENLSLRNRGAREPLPHEAPDSAFSRYTAMIGNLGGLQSPQSFVTHGFSGSNATQALRQLGYEMPETQTINTQARKLDPDPYDLRNRPTQPGTNAAARNTRQNTRNRAEGRMNTSDALPAGSYPESSLVPGFYSAANRGLGALAAKFESGSDGIAAIGYDRTGGTSYGKFQIASRVGTMDSFIAYLQEKAPDLAGRLSAAGPANTGSKRGKMPAEWRAIAAEQPERFERLQGDFVRISHFEPAMRAIADSTGLAFDKMPLALQEVLFSTAVQHGPSGATRIINQAAQRVGVQKLQPGDGNKSTAARKAEEQFITQIYNLRAGQFGSSTEQVQAAVRNRLRQEMREAIRMLS